MQRAGGFGGAVVAFVCACGEAVGNWRALWILGREVVLSTTEAYGTWTYVLDETGLVWRLLIVVAIDSSLVEVQSLQWQREGAISSLTIFWHVLDV